MSEEQPVRRSRGPGKKPRKIHISMRIPQYVYDYYGGDVKRLRDDIVLYVDSKIAHSAQEEEGAIPWEQPPKAE